MWLFVCLYIMYGHLCYMPKRYVKFNMLYADIINLEMLTEVKQCWARFVLGWEIAQVWSGHYLEMWLTITNTMLGFSKRVNWNCIACCNWILQKYDNCEMQSPGKQLAKKLPRNIIDSLKQTIWIKRKDQSQSPKGKKFVLFIIPASQWLLFNLHWPTRQNFYDPFCAQSLCSEFPKDNLLMLQMIVSPQTSIIMIAVVGRSF